MTKRPILEKKLLIDEMAISSLKTLEKCGYKTNDLISKMIIEATPFLIQRKNDRSQKGLIQYIYEFNR